MKQCYALLQCALLALVLLASAVAQAQNILLLWDDPDDSVENRPPLPGELNEHTQALIAALQAEGMSVTLSERSQGLYDGDSPVVETFEVVIHLNGNDDVFDVLPPSTVVELLAHVQNFGGGYIGSENNQLQIDLPLGLGLSAAMNDLTLIARGGGVPNGEITLSKIPQQSSHPLLAGLPNSFSFESTRAAAGTLKTFNQNPATALMTDELGSIALAVRSFGAGRIVSMHHGGNFNGSPTLSDPDVQQLYINAVRWADQRGPRALSITRNGPATLGPGSATFTVTFSENVAGVGPADFVGFSTGDVSYQNITVTPLTPRQFTVTLNNLSGAGTLGLRLTDDDSIVDTSFNQNPLRGDAEDGSLNGPVYTVDVRKPGLIAVLPPQPIIPLASRPLLSLVFSEPMDTSVFPAVVVQTASNGAIPASPPSPGGNLDDRVQQNIVALYTFNEGSGNLVRDISGFGSPLDLTIADTSAVSWLENGLRINAGTLLSSSGPASKIEQAVELSSELTIEAWVRPANTTQTGPARIVTLSDSVTTRNVTLGQAIDAYEGRLRNSSTDSNGLPAFSTPAGQVQTQLQHVVLVYGNDGFARLYVDGVHQIQRDFGGIINNWDENFALGVANEFSLNRPWLGELHLVAIYNRGLSAAEIIQNRDVGPVGETGGDGVWTNPITYRVTVDRAVVQQDAGIAQVAVSGARDIRGNVMNFDNEKTLSIISSGLEIITQPAPFTLVEAGSQVRLRVIVGGAAGSPDYEWMRQTGGGGFAPVGANSPTLTLNNADIDDSGFYKCVISDAQAVIESNVVQVEVVASLPGASALTLVLLVLLFAACANAARRGTPRS